MRATMKQNQIMRNVNRVEAFNLGEIKSSMQSCTQDTAFHKFSEVHSSKQMCAELSLLCKTLLQSSNLRVTIIYLQYSLLFNGSANQITAFAWVCQQDSTHIIRIRTLSAISVQWLEVFLETTMSFVFFQSFGGKFGCKCVIRKMILDFQKS